MCWLLFFLFRGVAACSLFCMGVFSFHGSSFLCLCRFLCSLANINCRTCHFLWFVIRTCIDPYSCVFDVETNQLLMLRTFKNHAISCKNTRFQTSLFHSMLFLDLTMIGMIAINLTKNG